MSVRGTQNNYVMQAGGTSISINLRADLTAILLRGLLLFKRVRALPLNAAWTWIAVLAVVSGCSQHGQPYELVSATGDVHDPALQRSLKDSIGKSGLLRRVKLGIWECYVPDEDPNSQLLCGKDGRVIVGLFNDSRQGFLVDVSTNKDNPAANLFLKDAKNDGHFNQLSYTGLDRNGSLSREAIDSDLDGRIDAELDYKNAALRVRIGNTWYRTEKTFRDASGKPISIVKVGDHVMRVYPFESPLRLEELSPDQKPPTNGSK